ncbi:MAG: hypothetical protein LBH06_00145, partial [Rikenellaceae bacterium]|nr:hypothetical protein [Rikenellaceae bacterium]
VVGNTDDAARGNAIMPLSDTLKYRYGRTVLQPALIVARLDGWQPSSAHMPPCYTSDIPVLVEPLLSHNNWLFCNVLQNFYCTKVQD